MDSIETPKSLSNRYRFIKQIGHGTQGDVFMAEKISDHTRVAIKRLNIHSVSNWKAYDLFQREASTLASLDIPGVAGFVEAIECLDDDPPCAYIVQDFIPGESLQALLKRNHRFSSDQIYDILIQLVDILKALHAHNPPVIHRDIKPSNILLVPRDVGSYKVYLIDFGAVANPQVQGGGSTVAGTFGYMPPEQLTGRPSSASDVYSLAAVAVYLFSGCAPADLPVKDFHLIFEPSMEDKPTELLNTLRAMLEPNADNRLSDLERIKDIFIKLRQNVYDALPNVNVEKLSDEAYQDKLIDVQSIGQDGNIELWQRLSDKADRNVPDVYRNFRPTKQNVLDVFPRKMRYTRGIISNLLMLILRIPLTIFLIPFRYLLFLFRNIFAVIVTMIVMATWILTAVSPLVGIGLLLSGQFEGFIFCFILFVVLLAPSSKWSKSNWGFIPPSSFTEYYGGYDTANEFAASCLNKIKDNFIGMMDSLGFKKEKTLNNVFSDSKSINRMIHSGRKTIATIVDIKYIPTKSVKTAILTEIIKTNDVYNTLGMMEEYVEEHPDSPAPCGFAVTEAPVFEISYKFNPPDDARESDLVHTIRTHVEPDNNYKIGDPISILYIIEKGNYKETVISMPFPFPMDDVFNEKDIMGSDVYYMSDREIVDRYKKEMKRNKKQEVIDAMDTIVIDNHRSSDTALDDDGEDYNEEEDDCYLDEVQYAKVLEKIKSNQSQLQSYGAYSQNENSYHLNPVYRPMNSNPRIQPVK